MHRLLLLLAAVLIVPTASAQWTFDSNFPGGENPNTPHVHGIGITDNGDGTHRVWVMPYYPFTGDSVTVNPFPTGDTNDCNAATGRCRTTALYAYESDGTPAPFSPLLTVTLPGGEADTLGGGSFTNADGNPDWAWDSGRGLRSSADGNVYFAMFNTIYKMDGSDASVLAVVEPTSLDTRGVAGPGVDDAGNVYVTGVFPGDPVAKYNSDLDFVENVASADFGFNRFLYASPDGNTVIVPNYSSQIATIFEYDELLFAYDSTGVTFEGMAVESITTHPTTGNIWASAGSPNDIPTGRYDDGAGNSGSYMPHTWYEFTVDQVMNNRAPVPSDSIVWNNPGDGRPRAIEFSPDGLTAYVGEFNLASPALQKFVFTGNTAVSHGPQIDGVELRQNTPNPFRGSTEISFELDNPADVRLAVYDVTGREVAVIAAGPHASGMHTATFRAGDLAGGVYVYSLQVDGEVTSRRMLHMR